MSNNNISNSVNRNGTFDEIEMNVSLTSFSFDSSASIGISSTLSGALRLVNNSNSMDELDLDSDRNTLYELSNEKIAYFYKTNENEDTKISHLRDYPEELLLFFSSDSTQTTNATCLSTSTENNSNSTTSTSKE